MTVPPSDAGQSEKVACPFCGSARIRDFYIRDGRGVGCRDCGASVHAFQPNALENAAANWNLRVGPHIATARVTRQDRIDAAIAACTGCGGREFPKRPDCDGCIAAVDEEIENELICSTPARTASDLNIERQVAGLDDIDRADAEKWRSVPEMCEEAGRCLLNAPARVDENALLKVVDAARGLFDGGFINAGTAGHEEWAYELLARLEPLRMALNTLSEWKDAK